MRLLLPALLALLVLAPGCTRSPAHPYDPSVPSDVGAARIVVQDNHQDRVANATVLVSPGGAYGHTDALGIYVAEDLPPGAAVVKVNANGYYDVQRDFTVKAGELQEVVVFMDRE
ncbi:MAG: carboxypeptidase-like regulatory domain-containing protein [Thermoplasmatota archaeon]